MDQEHFVINHKGNIILKDVIITGSIESSQDICLDGFIHGDVNCKGQVIINQGGVVNGAVNCDELFLKGEIVGNASVKYKAILKANAKIQGGLTTSCLEISSNAEIIQGLKLKNALK